MHLSTGLSNPLHKDTTEVNSSHIGRAQSKFYDMGIQNERKMSQSADKSAPIELGCTKRLFRLTLHTWLSEELSALLVLLTNAQAHLDENV